MFFQPFPFLSVTQQVFLIGSCSSGFAPANKRRGLRRRSERKETTGDTAVPLSSSKNLSLDGRGQVSRDTATRGYFRISILWRATRKNRLENGTPLMMERIQYKHFT